MYNECDIVKDLIPLYAEKLASFGSQDLIEEHCANCEECKKELELATKLVKPEGKDKPNNMDKVWANIAHQERKKRRQKRIFLTATASILVLAIFFSFSFIFRGNTWFVNVDLNVANSYENREELDSKSVFTHPGKDEVEAAAEEVKSFFESKFSGCILLSLSYDEELTYDKEYSQIYDDAIVFVSDYYVIIGDGSTINGEMMNYWRWEVRYNHNYDKWEVISYGYG